MVDSASRIYSLVGTLVTNAFVNTQLSLVSQLELFLTHSMTRIRSLSLNPFHAYLALAPS